jgi:hypothetical protein
MLSIIAKIKSAIVIFWRYKLAKHKPCEVKIVLTSKGDLMKQVIIAILLVVVGIIGGAVIFGKDKEVVGATVSSHVNTERLIHLW